MSETRDATPRFRLPAGPRSCYPLAVITRETTVSRGPRAGLAATFLPLLLVAGASAVGAGGCGSSDADPESSGGAGGSTASAGSGGSSSSSSANGTSSSSSGSGGGPCEIFHEHALFVAPGGDDAAAGSEADPFATIQHALDLAIPGDTVFVRAGVYAELVSFPASGDPGAPITLRAYCGEQPALDGAGLGTGLSYPALVSVVDRSHVVVDGFELRALQGDAGNFPAGIWLRGTVNDVVIQNNTVRDILAEDGGQDAGAHGIAVYGTKPEPTTDIRVLGNTLYDLVLGPSEALVINGNVRGFEVADNVVHDVNNIAFDFIGFESDVCPSCSQADVSDLDDVNRVRDGSVHGNLAHHMTTEQNPAYGGEKAAACFYVDGGANIVLERNIAHDCDLGVELASEHYQRATRDIVVRNNFLYANDVTGIATGGYDSGNGPGGGSAEDCFMVGNTIVDSSRNGWADAAILLQNRNLQNTFVNNIIVASPGSSTVADGGSANSGNVFDYNIYWAGALDGVSPGSHSMEVDPVLVAASAGDLHLADGSPALGAGQDLGAVLGEADIDGEPRTQGALDIGADER